MGNKQSRGSGGYDINADATHLAATPKTDRGMSMIKQKMETNPLNESRAETISALRNATQSGKSLRQGSAKGSIKGVTQVQLNSKPLGYGILLDGARNPVEGNRVGAGVFIADILRGSEASKLPNELKIGMQIVAVNSVNVRTATVKEVRALLSANSRVLLEVKQNKKLVNSYRKIRQLKSETVRLTLTAAPAQPLGIVVGEAPNGADGYYITAKLPGSAAAGTEDLQIGDKLVAVDGSSVIDMNPLALMTKLQTSTSVQVVAVRHQAALIEIEVVRSHLDESFGIRLAASKTRNINGYIITSIAPTGPAANAGLRVGWHVTMINGMNLEGMNEMELAAVLAANTKSAVVIRFGVTPNEKLLKLVNADKAAVRRPNVSFANEQDDSRRVTLSRGANGSFGVVFAGTSGIRSAQKGVFVSRVISGTVAADTSEVKAGAVVTEINGMNVIDSHIYDVARILNMVSTQMTMSIGPVSPMWKQYQETGHELLGEVGWIKMVIQRASFEPSWGVVFGGPVGENDIKSGTRGIFICGAQPGTAASRRPLPYGYQVMTLNGKNVENCTLTEAGEVLAAISGDDLAIAVKKNETLFDAYSKSDPIEVRLTKGDSGFGLFIAGPKDEREAKALGFGVVVSGTKITGAASKTGSLLVGWHVLQINGQDVSKATTSIVKSVLKNIGDEMVLRLIPNMQLAKSYQVKMPEYPWLKADSLAVIQIQRDENGYGLQFIGAKNTDEGKKHGFGVLINGLKPGSAAAKHGGVPIGWQIGRLNGVDLMKCTFDDVKQILAKLEDDTVCLVLIENPHLFARYSQLESSKQSEVSAPSPSPSSNTTQSAAQSQLPIGAVSTTVHKGSNGYGISFGGPKTTAQAEESGVRGIIVTRLKPGGAAELNGDVRIGWQVLTLNDCNLAEGTFEDLKRALDQAGMSITIVQVPNEKLLATYGDDSQTSVGQAASFTPQSSRPKSNFGFSATRMSNTLSAMNTPQTSTARPTVTATLFKDDNGFGVIFDGPRNEEEAQKHGYGLFVKSVKPGSVGERCQELEIGWQVTSVNGIDVADATFIEFKNALRSVEEMLILELEENNQLRDSYLGLRGSAKSASPALPDGAIRTVVEKGPLGYGLYFGGASTEDEAKEYGFGVFIRGTQPDSIAAKNPDIMASYQILTINGKDIENGMLSDLRSAVESADGKLEMIMKENLELANAYAIPESLPSVDAAGTNSDASNPVIPDVDDDDGQVVETMTIVDPLPLDASKSEHSEGQIALARSMSTSLISGLVSTAVTDAVAKSSPDATGSDEEALVEVHIKKGENGYGLQFGGPRSAADGKAKGFGVFISGCKPGSPAANEPKLVPGLQLVSLNDIDLTNATFIELKGALQDAQGALSLRLRANEELCKSYSTEVVEDIHVAVTKGDQGFGIKFGGPRDVNEANELGYGVFVSGAKPDTPAANDPKIETGLQVVSINDVSLLQATVQELKDTILSLKSDTLQLILRRNEDLYRSYVIPKSSHTSTANQVTDLAEASNRLEALVDSGNDANQEADLAEAANHLEALVGSVNEEINRLTDN